MNRKIMNEKSTHPIAPRDKNKSRETNDQHIREAVKLAVALQLRSEGYETVTFNRIVKDRGRSIVIDIFAEDCLGSQVAVYCVFSAHEAKEENLNDVALAIVDEFGEECLIAFAFPLRLIGLVGNAIGLAHRIYVVDKACRVWCHDPDGSFANSKLTWKPIDELEQEAVEWWKANASSKDIARRDFYIS